jgi:DNA-directed RNA polymerase I, II, and III subunit RPABC1
MNYEDEIYNLWRIRKTCLQMVNDRGYIVTSDELEQSLEDFKETFTHRLSNGEPNRSKLIILVSHNDDTTKELYIFFPDEPKVGVKLIQEYINRLKEENINHAIIVYNKDISPGAVKVILNNVTSQS